MASVIWSQIALDALHCAVARDGASAKTLPVAGKAAGKEVMENDSGTASFPDVDSPVAGNPWPRDRLPPCASVRDDFVRPFSTADGRNAGPQTDVAEPFSIR